MVWNSMGLEFRLTTPWRVAPRWLGCTSPGCGGFGHQRDDRQRRPPVGGTQQRRLLCQRWGGDNRPRTLSEPQREASVATKGVAKKLASLGPQSGAVDFNSSPTSQQFGLELRDITGLCTGAETMGGAQLVGNISSAACRRQCPGDESRSCWEPRDMHHRMSLFLTLVGLPYLCPPRVWFDGIDL